MSNKVAGDVYSRRTATATVRSGAGVLAAVLIDDPGSTITMTLYDNTSAAGTKICERVLAAGDITFGPNGVAFEIGLHLVLSGAAAVVICYRATP